MNSIIESWSKKVVKFRWFIVGVWIVLLGISAMYATQIGTLLTGGGWAVPGSGSNVAYELLSEEFEGRDATSMTLVMNHSDYEVGSSEYTTAIKSVSNFLLQEEEIESIYTWADASEEFKEGLIGDDKRTSIASIEMNVDEGFAQKIIPSIQERLTEHVESLGFDAVILGTPAFWGEVNTLSQAGLENAHLYALPIILIVLILVFRSIVSSIMPLILAAFSIALSLGSLYFVAEKVELSMFILDATLMLGIGVGIDFALIFVKRFREELEKSGDDIVRVVTKTMSTAGHSVLFSSLTIMGSMATILFVDISAVRSIALGVIAVVFFLMLTSLSLLPAILSILGKKVNALKVPFMPTISDQRKKGVWYRLSHKVMKRPVMYLVGTVLFLLILAYPAIELEVSTPDSRMLPEETRFSQGINYLQEGFGIGQASPISVVIQADGEKMTSEENLAFLQRLEDQIRALEHVEDVTSVLSIFPDVELNLVSSFLTNERNQLPSDANRLIDRSLSGNNDVIVIDVITNDYSSSEKNRTIVKEIRESIVPTIDDNRNLQIYVGGETAEGLDTAASLNGSLVPVMVFTLILIFVILVMTFKSILLPLKAILMNILSLGATYGILVVVFQWGWGSSILGFGDFGFIQSFIPILLLGLLFSLSTDYEVFLLSRIQEEYDEGKSNEESVALGLEFTAPMISGAALIMVAVFGSFAFAGVLPMQQLGLGMAVAIALDATFVRLLLVPATMKLLGDYNWWFPGKKRKFQQDNSIARESQLITK